MSHKNNSGYVLVTTIIAFSIIITVCIMCIGIVYRNSKILDLDFKSIENKEYAMSGLEIMRSNILNEVRNAIENTSSKDEFEKYFLGNDYYKTFMIKVTDISKLGIEELSVRVWKNYVYLEDGVINFDIQSNYSDGIYRKKFGASVKIKNPWNEEVQVFIEDEMSKYMNESVYKSNYYIDESDLIEIYNIKEL